jgi:uncharacterized membrane protein
MAKAKAAKASPKASRKSDDAKTYAIVAHLWFIGWIIALLMDKNKNPLVRFYLRQTLLIFLISLFSPIPFIGWVISVFALVLWIISLIGAINGEQKEIPLVGEYAQKWFKGL